MYDEELYHYGTKRHSGRYPWGSGEDPFQHESTFLDSYNQYKESGMTEIQIAEAMGMSTTDLRKRKTIEKESLKSDELAYALRLKEKGFSNVAIGEKIGRNESYVRNLLNPSLQEKARKTEVTIDILRDSVNESKYVDVGPGTEQMLGVKRTKMQVAVQKLQDEGYVKHYLKVPQVGIPGQYTYMQILCPPGTTWSEVNSNKDKIALPMENKNIALLRENNGDADKSVLGIRKPVSIDSNRIDIRYAEEGGKDMDGVIELRRGVDDISLGKANYAQVRIAVDGTHYLKGMAIYADDLPKGVDIRFNTNKTSDVAKMDVLKPMKTTKDGNIDWDNPFGASLEMKDGIVVGQRFYKDKNGEEKLSAINIVRSEGSWNTWSNTLASQFLSKQPMALINQQLNKSYNDKKDEFIDILKLTNPEIKKKLLEEFASDCDASASHLKAAALPRQSSKVILPLIDISDNEIYAPTYEDGEEVILVRYPHGGTFEIPTLTVNNKNKSGQRIIGTQAIDAVGISSKVAERLSGADFDGDTVVVIPTRGQKIKTSAPLEGLKNFDPKEQYGPKTYKGIDIQIMKDGPQKQNEMGKISNLITDMTLKGATPDELARAVKHSMVVIDAPKHKLNYKQSEKDNGIKELKIKYQGKYNAGASTLISKANSDLRIPEIVEKSKNVRTKEDNDLINKVEKNGIDILNSDEKRKYKIALNKMTNEEYEDYKEGLLIFRQTGETHLDKKGNEKPNINKVTKMGFREDGSVRTDAYELSSGTPEENAYANYANKLKSLANDARREYRNIPDSKYNPSARQTYAHEVASLNEKLKNAISNKPLERRAQLIANVTVSAKLKDNPDLDSDDIKKIKNQALAEARARAGASKSDRAIQISDREWEAIQAGAISSNFLEEILNNTDIDRVKQLATPRNSKELSDAQISKIKTLSDSGYTLSEIANSVGVSVSTVNNYLNE